MAGSWEDVPEYDDEPFWLESGYRGEYTCPHGVGHGPHVHGCCGERCCARGDFPYKLDSARKEKRRIASEFLQKVNASTVCRRCGGQPIEWHRKEHEERPNSRVSSLRAQGASVERIKRELLVSVPLCRSCHMTVDGRLDSLRRNQPYQKGQTYVAASPCGICKKEYKPLRRGLCYRCYERHRVGGRRFQHELNDGCCSADDYPYKDYRDKLVEEDANERNECC